MRSLRRRFARTDPCRKNRRQTRLQVDSLESRLVPSAALEGDLLVVRGTSGDDTIRVALRGVLLEVVVNDESNAFLLSDVNTIFISGGRGNDDIMIGSAIDNDAQISGGKGHDVIFGGAGDDLIRGDGGNDVLVGGGGVDILDGGRGRDMIDGGAGDDVLGGASGADLLFGGDGSDSIVGGRGSDNFMLADPSDTQVDFNPAADQIVESDSIDEVFAQIQMAGIRTFQLPGAPDIFTQETGFLHQSGEIDYSDYTNPPTYGPHHPPVSGVTPRPTGIYEVNSSPSEVSDEDLVHNLEHGHVWISYHPFLLAEDRAALEELVRGFGPTSGVILTPRADNDHLIALASWGHLLNLDALDLATVRNFVLTNRGYGKEGFITP